MEKRRVEVEVKVKVESDYSHTFPLAAQIAKWRSRNQRDFSTKHMKDQDRKN